jgi:hypothetical protein
MSADTMIGSVTTVGYLMTQRDQSDEIVHVWDRDH